MQKNSKYAIRAFVNKSNRHSSYNAHFARIFFLNTELKKKVNNNQSITNEETDILSS